MDYWLSRAKVSAAARRAAKGSPEAIELLLSFGEGGLSLEQAREDLMRWEDQGGWTLLPHDPLYEEVFGALLGDGTNLPFILYGRGNVNLLLKRKVGIVGSREVTGYGAQATKQLVAQLQPEEVVVSGGAKGVDALAHREALARGLGTICVIGCGLNHDYPRENAPLFRRLEREGLMLSEYEPHQRPRRFFFPERNRIIAALCDPVIVTCASMRSGALYTAEAALEVGHVVLCVPHPMGALQGAGCNALIALGTPLLKCAQDLRDWL